MGNEFEDRLAADYEAAWELAEEAQREQEQREAEDTLAAYQDQDVAERGEAPYVIVSNRRTGSDFEAPVVDESFGL